MQLRPESTGYDRRKTVPNVLNSLSSYLSAAKYSSFFSMLYILVLFTCMQCEGYWYPKRVLSLDTMYTFYKILNSSTTNQLLTVECQL